MVDLKEVEKELYDVESRRMTEEQYLANRIHQKRVTPTTPTNHPTQRNIRLFPLLSQELEY